MKRICIINILVCMLTNVFGQINYKLVLKGSCDSIESFEFDFYDFKNDTMYWSNSGEILLPDSGFYSLGVYIGDSDYVKSFSLPIIIDDYKARVDTLIVPKILFVTKRALHSDYWNYYYCKEVCNGIVKDYYPNGNISQEGKFLDGKPYWIKKYREDGTIQIKTDYKVGFLQYEKVEFYDEEGELEEYEVYRVRKRKTLKIVYDSEGNKIDQEVTKRYIEK